MFVLIDFNDLFVNCAGGGVCLGKNRKNCRRKNIPKYHFLLSEKRFWEIGDYAAQNVFLSTVMKKMVKWIYLLPHQFERNEEFFVCQQFLLNIFCIGRTRLRTVKEKVKNNQTVSDNRGKHTHFAKLTCDLKNIIYQHCESLSHKTSHYTNSQLKYFKDSSLTLKSLYKLFHLLKRRILVISIILLIFLLKSLEPTVVMSVTKMKN